MVMIISYHGGLQAQERNNTVTEGVFGDSEGWIPWWVHRPEPDVPVEVRREGDDTIDEITPRRMSLEWNIAGVFWRTPRGKQV